MSASFADLFIASAAQSVTIASPPKEAPYLLRQVVPVMEQTREQSGWVERRRKGEDAQKPAMFIFSKTPRERMIPAPPYAMWPHCATCTE